MSDASLSALFEQVPDPREASGRRHPLPAILTLTTVAMLSGARSLYAIAQFGRDRGPSFARAMSIDGKTLRGAQGDQLPGVHLLAAFAHEAKAAIGQMRVDAKTNEHKAASQLLELIDLQDTIVTGDATPEVCSASAICPVKSKGKRELPLGGQGQPAPTQRGRRRCVHV